MSNQEPLIDPRTLYTRCKHCHLFVDYNYGYRPGAGPLGVIAWLHLHRDDEADRKIDESHDAEPSTLIASLDAWRLYGPVEMRERFVIHPD